MKTNRWIRVGATAIAVLAGCEVGPNYKPPQMRVPTQFATTQPATQPATQPVDLTRWWETFQDPALDALIAEAVRSNLDVQLAQARVREARAQLEFNRAGLFPTLDSSAVYSRNRSSKNAFGKAGGTSTTSGGTTGGTTGGTGGTGSSSTGGTGSTPFVFSFGEQNLYQAGFDAGWEIDVFGGTRRAIEAAQATLEAQVDAGRNALVTLLSEVARNYIALRGLQHELAIVENNVAAQRDTLQLTRSRLAAGIATDLDVARAEAQVASTESQVPTLHTQIEQAIHRLGVLMDRDPDALEVRLSTDSPLPAGPEMVPTGLPSALLRRRPDVRQAERQLAASNANIGVAVAQLFPKFSLTSTLGLESLDLQKFLRTDSVFWSVGPQVSWRIFDAGQIWANIHVQNARQQEALIQYRQAVLQSLADVEDALTAYNQEQQRRRSLRQAVDSNRRAVDLAKQLNAAGLVDFLNVLQAQLSQYQSEDQLAQSDQTVSTNLVALYKALGGGWELSEREQSAAAR